MLLSKNGNKEARSARELAVQLLLRIELGGAYADRLLSSRNVSELTPLDRSFVRELVLGVLRWKGRLDHIIDSYYTGSKKILQPEIRMIVRLGLFQMMFLDSVPEWAAVDESVSIAGKTHGKKTAGLVNALLRRFSREGEPKLKSPDSAEKLSIQQSFPQWIVTRWISSFGRETAERIIKAGNQKHPVSVRVNSLKIDQQLFEERFSTEGFTLAPVSGFPGYYNVLKSNGLFETPLFQNGLFAVQDTAAGMASLLLSPESGETILDLCSAPGGKATHIAEIMGDTGRIDAVDNNPKRLKLVYEAAERLGLKSIRCIEGDAVSFRGENGEYYDRVLCDVPCTGTAVFSKRPDMKWRRNEEDIARLSLLQREILGNAASLVKPGGIIVYSTCSLEPEENDGNVHWFISEYDFTIERDTRFNNFETETGYLILPDSTGSTGAFAAKLRRRYYD